jgi:hypothetical protein
MNSEFNDQWILDRINTAHRHAAVHKSAWPAPSRRPRRSGRWLMPLSTDAIRLLDKSPKWVDRDM